MIILNIQYACISTDPGRPPWQCLDELGGIISLGWSGRDWVSFLLCLNNCLLFLLLNAYPLRKRKQTYQPSKQPIVDSSPNPSPVQQEKGKEEDSLSLINSRFLPTPNSSPLQQEKGEDSLSLITNSPFYLLSPSLSGTFFPFPFCCHFFFHQLFCICLKVETNWYFHIDENLCFNFIVDSGPDDMLHMFLHYTSILYIYIHTHASLKQNT